MSEILQSLKSDLLDRRLLPILLLLGVALAGAVAYTVLAGGGSAQPVAAAVAVRPPGTQGPSLSVQQAAANPNAAVAETTEGARYQHKAGAHNPFTPLPAPKEKTATTSSSSSQPTSSSSSSSSSPSPASKPSSSTPSSSGGGTTPAQPAPHKPKVVHRFIASVSVLFGPAPTTPGQLSQLPPYAAVKRGEALPSTSNPLLVFKNISSDHKSAIFTLSREAILKGTAACLPDASQCEAIDLQIGQSEELSYLEPSGQTVTYELVRQAVAWHEETATIARVHHRRHHHHR
jgi:hypothetical protein